MKKFKNILIKDIKSNEMSFFSIHVNEQKFRHTFKECGSTLCGCGLEIEST